MPANPADAPHVPESWTDLARRLTRGEAKRVFVLGAADSGKSTLCRFLLDAVRAAGRPAAILDLDPGQKLIGPPACVTLGRTGADGGLALAAMAFVGAIDPMRGFRRTVQGTARLSGLPAAEEIVLANSDGLLRGPGRSLKAAEIRSFQPDLLVTLGGDPALDAVLEDHAGLPARRLEASSLARRKTQGERKAARRQAFHSHFAVARPWPVPAGRLRIEDAPAAGLPPRLLAGLADRNGHDLALAIVLTPGDPTGHGLVLLTGPAGRRHARRLRCGSLVLDADCREQRLSTS